MRITNNVIMRNTKTNINGNKLNVNDMNNQMSSQKKIALPSDDPVIAVRALRLRSNLGELDQYLNTNIEQADSWLDITETAIGNISSLLNKIYECCMQGANDTLNQDDRNAILAQLRQNRDQIHSEGNTDYAGRTVFTGYKTNAPLSYTKSAPKDHYEIDQRLSFEDIMENQYIYNQVDEKDISNFKSLADNPDNEPGSKTISRIRLAYDNLDAVSNKKETMEKIENGTLNESSSTDPLFIRNVKAYNYAKEYKSGNTEKVTAYNTYQQQKARMTNLDSNGFHRANYTTLSGMSDADRANYYTLNPDGTINTVASLSQTQYDALTDAEKEKYKTGQALLQEQKGKLASAGLASDPQDTAYDLAKYDADKAAVTAYESANDAAERDALQIVKNNINGSGEITQNSLDNLLETAALSYYSVTDGTVVCGAVIHPVGTDGKVDTANTIDYVPVTTEMLEAQDYDIKALSQDKGIVLNVDTGELLFTDDKAKEFRENQQRFQITYDKTGFAKGDLTPEDYFDCRKYDLKNTNQVEKNYTHFEEDGSWITEEINYTVAINQEFAINVEAKDVLNQNIGRDVTDLESAVQAAINAYDKVTKLENMMNMEAYKDEDSKAKLGALLERANKEAAFADDQMRDLFSKYVGRFKDYINTVELARTDVGARGDRLAMTKNRVEAQYNTVDKLKSQNEDADLSDIVIDYQASYLAYQASLQAAAKVQQQTLLDYI